MLKAKNLKCVRGGRVLFEGLSFKVSAGKTLVVRGRNGSGKTTLLNIVNGIITPDDGEILWRNKNISSDPFSFKKDLAFLGHKNAVKQYQTVCENLEFWRQCYENPHSIEITIDKLKLKDVLDMPCYMLSAGWQRRVGLARLFISNASIWMMDEPFANLDKVAKQLFSSILKQHLKNGGIAIVSTNDNEFSGIEVNLDSYL